MNISSVSNKEPTLADFRLDEVTVKEASERYAKALAAHNAKPPRRRYADIAKIWVGVSLLLGLLFFRAGWKTISVLSAITAVLLLQFMPRHRRDPLVLPEDLADVLARKASHDAALTAYRRAQAAEQERVWLAEQAAKEKQAEREPSYWTRMDGLQFEKAVARLFRDQGYTAELTKHTGDGGVDINMRKDGKSIVVQCKAHDKSISISTVRELKAVRSDFSADEAWLVCFYGATGPAAAYATENGIRIIDAGELAEIRRNTRTSS